MDELDNLRGLVEEKNEEIRELENEIEDLKMEVNTLEDKIEEAHDLGYIIMKKAEEVLDIWWADHNMGEIYWYLNDIKNLCEIIANVTVKSREVKDKSEELYYGVLNGNLRDEKGHMK